MEAGPPAAGDYNRPMFDTLARPRSWSGQWPVIACAALFFLGTADQFFAVRVHGVTLRLAQLALCIAIIVWWRTKAMAFPENHRRLLIAWAPFFCIFLLVSALSADPLPGLLKLAWFAFNFLGAYAWSQLFWRRDLVLGYFSAYFLVAAVIVFDFFIGFGGGSEHMIGYAQPTYGVPGREGWFRPHAFYYEPSYAAAGLGLAWALALTTLYVHAPKTSAALVILGITALATTFSRTGWVYALIAMVAISAVGGRSLRLSLRRRAVYLGICGLALLALVLFLVPEQSRGGVRTLLRALGVSQTIERICPIIDARFPSLDIDCLEGVERARALPFNRPDEPPEQTSEGSRLLSWETTFGRIQAHPWVGEGVVRSADRLISPTVPNTWLEIGVEGGVFALMAFVWGLAVTIYQWDGLRWENRAVGVALLLYFLVIWQFIQTFPRLDQWLSFWMALAVIRAERGTPVTRSSRTGLASMSVPTLDPSDR